MNPFVRKEFFVFGLKLSSDYNFKTNLTPTGKSDSQLVDLHFSCSQQSPNDLDSSQNEVFYQSKLTQLKIYKNQHWQIIEYPGHTSFYLCENQIHCQLDCASNEHLVEIRLFGFVLSYWLTWYKKNTLIHASSVSKNNRNAIFIATNAGGKTSLACAMIKHTDYSILTDDILRIAIDKNSISCYSSYPQIRLWPEQITDFLAQDPDTFNKVHPQFNKRRVKLPQPGLGGFELNPSIASVIFKPNRSTSAKRVKIAPLSAQQAFLLIKKNLFIRDLLTSKDVQINTFDTISKIANTVPAFEITYPEGFEHLPRVCHHINEHIEKELNCN